jgi:hypothetical protein
MRRILTAVLLVFFYCGVSYAAGSSVTKVTDESVADPFGMKWAYVGDSSTGAFPSLTVSANVAPGWIESVCVDFDNTTPPSAVVITVTNNQGVAVLVSDSLTASGCVNAETATTKVHPSLVPVAGGFTIALTTNSTNSAKLNLVVNGVD